MASFRPRLSLENKSEWESILSKIKQVGLNKTLEKLGIEEVEETVPVAFSENEKNTDLSWREMIEPMKGIQSLKSKNSKSQRTPTIHLEASEPIILLPFGDQHLGAMATDYEAFVSFTEEILSNPRIYVFLLGDLVNLAIKLRGVAEVQGDILNTDLQLQFLESWLDDVQHKLIASVAGNHDDRFEKLTGSDIVSKIVSARTAHSPGLQHVTLKVGEAEYKIAASHLLRGYSMYNPLHAQHRYLRTEAPWADLVMSGHTHRPAFSTFLEAGKKVTLLNCGTTKTNDGYAKKYFSLYSQVAYPVVVLNNKEKVITPYWSLKEANDSF